MKKEKILKFILLLAISFAVMRIYELMQYFVGVYVFGFKLDTPPNVSQAFFDTVCCSFQIAVFWILYMMTKRLYFDRGEDIEEVEETRLGIKDVPRLLPKLIVISLGVSGLVNLFMVFAENFLTFIPAIKESLSSFDNTWSAVAAQNYLFQLGSIVILGPIVEEFMFRGFIYNAAKKFMGDYFAIFFSAVLFGIWHRELIQGIYVTFVAIVLGIVYMRTRNIIYPMILHILNNFYSALPPRFSTEAWNFRVTVLCYIMLLPALYLVYKIFKNNKGLKKIEKNEKYFLS